MTAIPQAYLDIILPLIGKARDFLERGETLAPIAFVGNFATQQTTPVLIDSRDEEAKDRSARAVKRAAESVAADFIFMIMEAWSLQKDQLHHREEIMERYGSIGASPYKIDIVSFSLETRHGIWMAQASIKPKGHSKKKRIVEVITFISTSYVQVCLAAVFAGAATECPVNTTPITALTSSRPNVSCSSLFPSP